MATRDESADQVVPPTRRGRRGLGRAKRRKQVPMPETDPENGALLDPTGRTYTLAVLLSFLGRR